MSDLPPIGRAVFDRSFGGRVRALLRLRPVADAADNATRQSWGDERYNVVTLGLAAIDSVVARQGFDDEVTYDEVVAGLQALAATAHAERPADEHGLVARYVVDALLNRREREAPFRYQVSIFSRDQDGAVRHRQVPAEFRLPDSSDVAALPPYTARAHDVRLRSELAGGRRVSGGRDIRYPAWTFGVMATRRHLLAVASTLAISLVLTACGSGNEDVDTGAPQSGSTPTEPGSTGDVFGEDDSAESLTRFVWTWFGGVADVPVCPALPLVRLVGPGRAGWSGT